MCSIPVAPTGGNWWNQTDAKFETFGVQKGSNLGKVYPCGFLIGFFNLK